MLEVDFCCMQYTQYLLFRGVNANLHYRINLIVLQTALKLNNVSGLRIGGLVINATEMSCHPLFMPSKFDIHLYTFSWEWFTPYIFTLTLRIGITVLSFICLHFFVIHIYDDIFFAKKQNAANILKYAYSCMNTILLVSFGRNWLTANKRRFVVSNHIHGTDQRRMKKALYTVVRK